LNKLEHTNYAASSEQIASQEKGHILSENGPIFGNLLSVIHVKSFKN